MCLNVKSSIYVKHSKIVFMFRGFFFLLLQLFTATVVNKQIFIFDLFYSVYIPGPRLIPQF